MPGEGGAARRAGAVPTIFAMGGGGFTMEPENPALDDYVRTLAPAREPRICLLPTAGDINPTLTLHALASRTAARLLD